MAAFGAFALFAASAFADRIEFNESTTIESDAIYSSDYVAINYGGKNPHVDVTVNENLKFEANTLSVNGPSSMYFAGNNQINVYMFSAFTWGEKDCIVTINNSTINTERFSIDGAIVTVNGGTITTADDIDMDKGGSLILDNGAKVNALFLSGNDNNSSITLKNGSSIDFSEAVVSSYTCKENLFIESGSSVKFNRGVKWNGDLFIGDGAVLESTESLSVLGDFTISTGGTIKLESASDLMLSTKVKIMFSEDFTGTSFDTSSLFSSDSGTVTLSADRVMLVDSNGNEISGCSFTTGENGCLVIENITVPEPSAFAAALGAAAIGLAAWRRRK